MLRSPFPRPESEAVQVVDLLVDEPEIVQTGSPPCLKCALAASAVVAVIATATNTVTARSVRRILASRSGVPAVGLRACGHPNPARSPVDGCLLGRAVHRNRYLRRSR